MRDVVILYEAGSVDVRLTRTTFKGSERVDIRIYAEVGGEHRPTRKGVSVPMEHVPALIDALCAMTGP